MAFLCVVLAHYSVSADADPAKFVNEISGIFQAFMARQTE
jgi:hypothetical protein